MIRGFPVLFALLFLSNAIPLEQSPPLTEATGAPIPTRVVQATETVSTTASVSTSPVATVPVTTVQTKKIEVTEESKLVEEADNVQKLDVSSGTAVVQETPELKLNDEMTVNDIRMSTTETPKLVESAESPAPSIDSVGALEPDEDGEQLRQPSEKELAELSESIKEKEEPSKDGAVKSDVETESGTEQKEEVKEEDVVEATTTAEVLVTREPEKEGKTMEEDLVGEEEEKKEGNDADAPEDHEVIETEHKEEEPKALEKETAAEELAEKIEEEMTVLELIQLLIMLTPTEKEVSWFTIIVEAVKCSLRNCPNPNSYWRRSPMYLPRITRHRRQDADFGLEAVPTTPKPCACQNLREYFEKMYEETIGKTKEEMNETRSDV